MEEERGEKEKGRRESEISMHHHLEIKEFFWGQILLDQQGLYVQGLGEAQGHNSSKTVFSAQQRVRTRL